MPPYSISAASGEGKFGSGIARIVRVLIDFQPWNSVRQVVSDYIIRLPPSQWQQRRQSALGLVMVASDGDIHTAARDSWAAMPSIHAGASSRDGSAFQSGDEFSFPGIEKLLFFPRLRG